MKKSIIGFGYKPINAKALCLTTNRKTHLGDAEYLIIADPYLREFTRESPKETYKELAVNVLDPATGLTYAVEYEPANLVRKIFKPFKWGDIAVTIHGARMVVNKVPEETFTGGPAKVDADAFLRRMKELAQEIDSLTDKNSELREECAVVFFATKRNNEEKTADGVSLISGEAEVLVDSMAIPARKSKAVAEMIRKAAANISAWQFIRKLAHADYFML